MRKFGQALVGVDNGSKKEGYVGRVSSSSGGGSTVFVANASGSQIKTLPASQYGISSTPPTGLMAFVIVGQGSDKDGIVGVYDPNRPQCNTGDCMMYSSGGATIKCKNDKVLLNDVDILDEISKIKSKIGM